MGMALSELYHTKPLKITVEALVTYYASQSCQSLYMNDSQLWYRLPSCS